MPRFCFTINGQSHLLLRPARQRCSPVPQDPHCACVPQRSMKWRYIQGIRYCSPVDADRWLTTIVVLIGYLLIFYLNRQYSKTLTVFLKGSMKWRCIQGIRYCSLGDANNHCRSHWLLAYILFKSSVRHTGSI